VALVADDRPETFNLKVQGSTPCASTKTVVHRRG
jgi:hypothetical protein